MAAGSHVPVRASGAAGALRAGSQQPPPVATEPPVASVAADQPPGASAGRSALSSSRRVLSMASDERLVARLRAGSEAAFAVLYERYHRNILSFCRHMLGSRDQAEDAVQQTFTNAYRDLLRDEREVNFRPWLYRIARNHCISLLRRRREEIEIGANEPSLVGLSEKVAGRAELRELLADLARLPVEQREALILSELQDNSHAEVAEILGCDRDKVKSLVFQARSSLISSREAREVSCDEIRGQLSVLRGGSLRRKVLRRHLKACAGCKAFNKEVKRQRQALALILPVFPSSVLKLGTVKAIASVKAGGVATSGAVVGGPGAGSAVVGGGPSWAGAAGGGGAVATGAGPGGLVFGSLTAIAGKLGVPVVLIKGIAATGAVALIAGGGTVAVKDAEHALKNGGAPAVHGSDRPGSESSAIGDHSGNNAHPGGEADAVSRQDGGHPGSPNSHSVNGRLHSALGGLSNAPGHTKPSGKHRAIGKGGAERQIGQGRTKQLHPNAGHRPSVQPRHTTHSKPAPSKPALPSKGGRAPSRPGTRGGAPSLPDEGTTGP